MTSRTRYFFSRLFDCLRLHPAASVLDLSGIAACLLLCGSVLAVFSHCAALVPFFAKQQKIEVMLLEKTTADELEAFLTSVRKLPQIAQAAVLSKEEVIRAFSEQPEHFRKLPDILRENPRSAFVELLLNPLQHPVPETENLARALSGQGPPVQQVFPLRSSYAETLESARENETIAVAAVSAAFILGVVLIIFNRTRIIAVSSGDELAIHHLVGAAPLFSTLPYYASGAIFGLAGALISCGVFAALMYSVKEGLPTLVAAALPAAPLELALASGFLAGCAVLAGIAGSWLALKTGPQPGEL